MSCWPAAQQHCLARALPRAKVKQCWTCPALGWVPYHFRDWLQAIPRSLSLLCLQTGSPHCCAGFGGQGSLPEAPTARAGGLKQEGKVSGSWLCCRLFFPLLFLNGCKSFFLFSYSGSLIHLSRIRSVSHMRGRSTNMEKTTETTKKMATIIRMLKLWRTQRDTENVDHAHSIWLTVSFCMIVT